MKTLRRPAGWSFALLWWGAQVLGLGGLGAVLHFPGDFPASREAAAFAAGPAAFGALLGGVNGLAAGVLGWLVLRGRVPHAGAWVWAMALSAAVTHGLNDGQPYAARLGLNVILSVLAAGVLQGLALRRLGLGAGFAGLVPAAGWLAGWVIGWAGLQATGWLGLEWRLGLDGQTHGLFSGAFGAVYGLITAALLARQRRD